MESETYVMGSGMVFKDPEGDNAIYSSPMKTKSKKRRKHRDKRIPERIEEAPPLPEACMSEEELKQIHEMEYLFTKYQKSCDELTGFYNTHFSEDQPYGFMQSVAVFRRVLLSLKFQINTLDGCVKLSQEQVVTSNRRFKNIVNKTFKKGTMMNTTESIRKRNESVNGPKSAADISLERRAIRAAIQLATEVMRCYEECRSCYDGLGRGGKVVRRVEGEMEKINEEVMMMNFVLMGQCVPQ